jgi:hypothetical protein
MERELINGQMETSMMEITNSIRHMAMENTPKVIIVGTMDTGKTGRDTARDMYTTQKQTRGKNI